MHGMSPADSDPLSTRFELASRLDDGEGLDDDERALSSLRAGRHESWLAYRLTTALRVAQLHAMDNVAVEEAAAGLAEVLDDYLLRNGRVSLILDRECVYLNGRLVRTGTGGNWLHDFNQLLLRRGIGGLLFAGAWAPGAARGLIQAFKSGGGSSAGERAKAVAQATASLVTEPARVTVLDAAEAREYVRESEEASLTPTEQAAFYYARLVALADVAHQAVGAGLSPDTYARNVRQTLRKVYEFLEHPVFERRILALTRRPPGEMPLGAHAAAVCVLSLCMGRLLGLGRGELSDLGFAALFHDLGRSLRARRAKGGQEDMEQARAHPLDGVAFALRGHAYGHSELLRLVVAQEHHRLVDGYPDAGMLRKPHAYSRLIAAADAYHKLQSGTPWSGPVGQAKAITMLRDAPERHDPGAVALLVDVLGRCPRGTILRLADGGTVVTLDGAPRRGHLPVVRQITLPDRTLDTSDHVYTLTDFKQIKAEVDPSGVSLDEWSALSGKGIPCEVPDQLPEEGALVTGSGDLVDGDAPDPTADAREVKLLVEQIEKAIRLYRLYPTDHPYCAQAIDQLDAELTKYLEWRGMLTLELRREGVHLGERLVVADGGNASSLSYLLYPDGVRTLRFERGLDRTQTLDFVATLARSDGDTGLDLMDALWQREFNHIDHVAYDQLAPGAVERLNDPMLNPVGARLLAILPECQAVARRLSVELAPHRDWIAGRDDPAAGADPAQLEAYLTTAGGQKRKALLDQLHDSFLGDTLGRATDIVAWAAADEDDPPPVRDVGRFLAGVIGAALWKGDLGRAADILSTGSTMNCLGAVCRRLSRTHALELWARGLEGQGDQALRYLSFFPDGCLPALVKLYGNLVGNDAARQVLGNLFATRLDAVAEWLTPLTLHADARIAEEAIALLARGQPGSAAHARLESFAADHDHRVRAERARLVLAGDEDEDESQTCLRALQDGQDKHDRLQAARRLRKLGDSEAFDALRLIVQSREFLAREEDEIEAILGTLSALGGLRAVSVLQELSKRRGLINRKGTVRINRAAASTLKALRETSGPRKGVACPRCKFENTSRATKCLSCGTALDNPSASQSQVVTRRESRPAVVPSLDDEVVADAVVPSLADEVQPTQPRSGDELQTVRFKSSSVRAHVEPLPAPRVVVSEEDAANAVLWLRCHPFDPIPVGHKPVVEIGRSAKCDMVLAHGSVSRVHAIVRLVGGGAVIEDRSSYGTYVNGTRVHTHDLSAGDTLTIGPYDIEALERDVSAPSDEEGTRPLRTFASSEAIGGRLERVSLAEVLQQIEFNEKTGTLEVFAEGLEGVFVVYEGKPIYANLGDTADADAVIQMLRLRRGTFSFAAKVEAGEMTMAGQTITGLLMDASRQLDEESVN